MLGLFALTGFAQLVYPYRHCIPSRHKREMVRVSTQYTRQVVINSDVMTTACSLQSEDRGGLRQLVTHPHAWPKDCSLSLMTWESGDAISESHIRATS